MAKSTVAAFALVALLTAPLGAEDKPRESGVTEEVETRLAQIDVTVVGPTEGLLALSADDFEVWVNRTSIHAFTVDPSCQDVAEVVPGESVTAERRVTTPATVLFYFDQPHLTMAGRNQAIDIAREIIQSLDGDRAMIMSNARSLMVYAPLTSDKGRLLSALDDLANDPEQVDAFSVTEASRIRDLERQISDTKSAIQVGLGGSGSRNSQEDDSFLGGGVNQILEAYLTRLENTARGYQNEEIQKTATDLQRLQMALARIADSKTPKALVYFADTMRANAGQHYLEFLRRAPEARELFALSSYPDRRSGMRLERYGRDSPTQAYFDNVVSEAGAHGVRVYSIEAQGLAQSAIRVSDAQDTLAGLALETGGRSFLNGVPAEKIAEVMERDLSCVFLISFDPTGLPNNKPLAVKVRINKPGVEWHARGVIVLQTESERLKSRLLAAYLGDADDAALTLRLALIPLGYEDGDFKALLQVVAPQSGLPGSKWDVGASVVSQSTVREGTSSRIEVDGQTAFPLLFQREIAIPARPAKVVAVAYENVSGEILSGRLEVSWPDPDKTRAVISPVAVVQPGKGLFVGEDGAKVPEFVAYGSDESVALDRPTALMSLVCLAKRKKGSLVVERKLEGAETVEFPPIALKRKRERCAQVTDMIREGTLSEGYFRYELSVADNGELLAQRDHVFEVIESHYGNTGTDLRHPGAQGEHTSGSPSR